MRILRVVVVCIAVLVALAVVLDLATRKWTALVGDLVLALVVGLILALLRRR